MRLFVAVEIDEDVRRVAAAAGEELRRVLTPLVNARWVPLDKMHLTVRFIGQVDDLRAPAVVEALAPPLQLAPFEIELGACGAFPPGGQPRVLWIGLSEGLASLARMHDALNRRLQPLAVAADARPFSAHLTLARLKDAPRGSARAVRDALRQVAVPRSRWRVSHATLFRSHVSSAGSRYESLASIPLLDGAQQDA